MLRAIAYTIVVLAVLLLAQSLTDRSPPNTEKAIPFTVGNPNADVTIVEFFDYNCPHCRRVLPTLIETLDRDPNIKLELREFPVIAETSEMAARYAIAAHAQGKYVDMHVALMQSSGLISLERIEQIAKDLGLNFRQLQMDSRHPDVTNIIAENKKFAQDMGVDATPTFFVNNIVVASGSLKPEELLDIIDEARDAAQQQ